MAAALLWPAFLNGGPFWFPDTSNYLRGADAGVVYLTGERSEWSDRLAAAPPEAGPAAEGARTSGVLPARPVLSGRSIYYGYLIYVPMRLFDAWGAIALQALLVAGAFLFCIAIATRLLERRRFVWILSSAAVAVVLTPLPFYTSMLMPDVFAGILIALCACAICLNRQMTRWESVAAIGAAAVIATFHTSHVLLALAVGAAGFLVVRGTGQRVRSLLIGGGAAAVGAVSAMMFSAAVEHALGSAPVSPPFLSARLSHDGPAIGYLRDHCDDEPAGERFALCAYRDRLPLHSDAFLWSEDPANGVFQIMPPEMQRRISAEDTKFFLAVLAADPLGTGSFVLRSMWAQLGQFDLVGFNYPEFKQPEWHDKYPARVAARISESRAADGTMPTAFVTLTTVAACGLAFAATIGLGLAYRRRSVAVRPEIVRFATILFLGVLANALICGGLSRPTGRYQMRIIWLLPFAAQVVASGASRRVQMQAAIR